MIDQPLLFRCIESQMPRIAFTGDVFDDLEALRLRFRTGLRDDARDLGFRFGGAFEPDRSMRFLVLLGKLVEAIEALAQGRIDTRRLSELRQLDGEGHVDLELTDPAAVVAF